MADIDALTTTLGQALSAKDVDFRHTVYSTVEFECWIKLNDKAVAVCLNVFYLCSQSSLYVAK